MLPVLDTAALLNNHGNLIGMATWQPEGKAAGGWEWWGGGSVVGREGNKTKTALSSRSEGRRRCQLMWIFKENSDELKLHSIVQFRRELGPWL